MKAYEVRYRAVFEEDSDFPTWTWADNPNQARMNVLKGNCFFNQEAFVDSEYIDLAVRREKCLDNMEDAKPKDLLQKIYLEGLIRDEDDLEINTDQDFERYYEKYYKGTRIDLVDSRFNHLVTSGVVFK